MSVMFCPVEVSATGRGILLSAVCPIECDLETSKMRGSRTTKAAEP